MLLKEYNNCQLIYHRQELALIITATDRYISHPEFVEAFEYAESLMGQLEIKKVVFDQRKLSVFNKESMTWYYLEWKTRLFKCGLIKHIKVMPDNKNFKQLIRLFKQDLDARFPKASYHNLQIKYCEAIQEGFKF